MDSTRRIRASQAYTDRTWENVSGRITWQVTPRNKIGVFWDEQVDLPRSATGATHRHHRSRARLARRPTASAQTKPLRVPQATWSSPVTSRLLLDAGFGGIYYGWGNFERDPNPTHDLIRVAEQCAAGCAANGSIPGLVYRSQDFGTQLHRRRTPGSASASYVTGAHSMKVGYQGTVHDRRPHLVHQQPEPRRTASTTACRTS